MWTARRLQQGLLVFGVLLIAVGAVGAVLLLTRSFPRASLASPSEPRVTAAAATVQATRALPTIAPPEGTEVLSTATAGVAATATPTQTPTPTEEFGKSQSPDAIAYALGRNDVPVPPRVSTGPRAAQAPQPSGTETSPRGTKTIVTADVPEEIETDGTITVSLENVSPTGNAPATATVEANGQEVSFDLAPLDCDIDNLFDPKYQASATVELFAPGFDPLERKTRELYLMTDHANFTWVIEAKEETSGKKQLQVEIDVSFTIGDGPPQICAWDDSFSVEVVSDCMIEPLGICITADTVSIGSLLSGVLGSGLSIPFAYTVVKDRRTKPRL